MSERHEQSKCNTTATLVTPVQHGGDTSVTRVLHDRHECKTNVKSATRVKNVDFDKDTDKNIFSHPCIYIW